MKELTKADFIAWGSKGGRNRSPAKIAASRRNAAIAAAARRKTRAQPETINSTK